MSRAIIITSTALPSELINIFLTGRRLEAARVTKLLLRNYRFDWIAPGEIQIYAEIRRKYKLCVVCR